MTAARWTILHYCSLIKHNQSSFFHNSRLIRWIQQDKIYKKILDQGLNPDRLLSCQQRSNHYTGMIFVFVWGCNWILFVYGWFCPICIIHLIGRKSSHFEKNIKYSNWGPFNEVRFIFKLKVACRWSVWVILPRISMRTMYVSNFSCQF